MKMCPGVWIKSNVGETIDFGLIDLLEYKTLYSLAVHLQRMLRIYPLKMGKILSVRAAFTGNSFD